MKLGILSTDHVHEEFVGEFGEYIDMFRELFQAVDQELELVNYWVIDDQFPQEIDEVDAYLITGSRHSVYEDKAWIHRLGTFIQELHRKKKKLVGICFGHQMIAHFLGGKTEKATVGWSIGTQGHSFRETNIKALDAHPEGRIIFSHQDQVTELPSNCEVLASTAKCPIAVFQVEDHILGIQGHPEFAPAYSGKLFTRRRELFGEALYHETMNSLEKENDRYEVAKWIVDFIKA